MIWHCKNCGKYFNRQPLDLGSGLGCPYCFKLTIEHIPDDKKGDCI